MAYTCIPGTAQEIIEKLISHKKFSIKELAKQLGVCDTTIYRIRQGTCPLPETHFNLIQLYISMKDLSIK